MEKIKLIKSTFYREEETKKRLADFIMNSHFLKMGKECRKFEEKFSKKQERKYAVFVSSGSSANLILIQSLLNLGYLKKGNTIALSSLTWATNVMPIIQLGLKPFLLDCEINNLNVSRKILEESYSQEPNIKCLFLTNTLGFAADLQNIKKFCKEKMILLLEDNCESLGSKIRETLLGNFGSASTFSFFVGHHLSTIEGGMVCTDNKDLYAMLVKVRAHGWSRDLNKESQQKLRKAYNIDHFYSKYAFYDLSYNVRPTEINGFLGNIQVDYWNEIVNKRYLNFKAFLSAIRKNKDIIQLDLSHLQLVSNFAFPVIFKNKDMFTKYKQKFEEANIEIRPIIAGNIEKQPFFRRYVKEKFGCKNADFIHQNGFYFGNNPEMTQEEISLICKICEGNVD